MEYILDELKQFVIKQVYEFEDLSQSYLIVYYYDDKKNISAISLILEAKGYYIKNGNIIYIGSGRNNHKVQKVDPCEIFQIDKSIDLKKFIEIKNEIVNKIDLTDMTEIKKIQVGTEYFDDNNFIIANKELFF